MFSPTFIHLFYHKRLFWSSLVCASVTQPTIQLKPQYIVYISTIFSRKRAPSRKRFPTQLEAQPLHGHLGQVFRQLGHPCTAYRAAHLPAQPAPLHRICPGTRRRAPAETPCKRPYRRENATPKPPSRFSRALEDHPSFACVLAIH